MNGQLIEISVRNFRGLVRFDAKPNGKSFELRGKNGASKSNVIDSLWWGLGGKLEDDVIRNGEADVETRITIGDYLVTRRQAVNKKPVLTVSMASSPSVKFNSPTALLSGFLGAIERRTFSTLKPSEQAEVLRKLCPEIDTSKLDREYERKFAERTDVNRDLKSLMAQIDGIEVPDEPEVMPDDVDLVAIAAKKTEAEKVRAEGERLKSAQQASRAAYKACEDKIEKLTIELSNSRKAADAEVEKLLSLAKAVSSIVPIDTTAIDAEIAEGRAENARRAQVRQKAQEVRAARNQKEKLERDADGKQFESDTLTQKLDDILATKSKQLAAAKLPIEGLAVKNDTVTFTQGDAGPVAVGALNTATRMRLDVVIAKALGHKLVAVRDASLLDEDSREELNVFARQNGVQLISEVVARGEALTVEIVDADE